MNKFWVLSLIVLSLSACFNFKEQKSGSNPQGQIDTKDHNPITEPTFADIQKYVITPYCVRCHGASRPAFGINLSTYAATVADAGVVNPGNPMGSSFVTSIHDGSMPVGDAELSKDLKDMVFNWVKAGALEGGGAQAPSPAPAPVEIPAPAPSESAPTPSEVSDPSFAEIQKYVITPYCVSCHGSSDPSFGIDLSTYAATLVSAEVVSPGNPLASSFVTTIQDGSMPAGAPELSKDLKDMVFNWVKAGAREKAGTSDPVKTGN